MRDVGLGEQPAHLAESVALIKWHRSQLRVQIDRFFAAGHIQHNFLQEPCPHTTIAERGQHRKTFQLDAVFRDAPAGGADGLRVQKKQVMMRLFFAVVFQAGVDALLLDKHRIPDGESLVHQRLIRHGEFFYDEHKIMIAIMPHSDNGAKGFCDPIAMESESATNRQFAVVLEQNWRGVVGCVHFHETPHPFARLQRGKLEIIPMKKTLIIAAAAILFAQKMFAADTPTNAPFPVTIAVDAAKPLGELKPIWRFFGADEPNYATMPDGKKLISELGALAPNKIYFRAHNLLCSGDGTPALKWGSTGVYSEDADGKPIYNWKILDEIFDTYLTNGVRPYAQIGFMPEALSTHPQPYQHHWKPGDKYSDIETGWAYPPKDYDKWRELIFQWVTHCITRYGRAEVATWYWEVWNEANGSYWKAPPSEFHKLHDYAIDGVRRALPEARVGGPDAAGAGGKWTRDFIEHCLRGTNYATGKIGTPLDFIAFHAKGSPTFTNSHVRMGMASQLNTMNEGFAIVKSYPELKNIPIIIGESDPEGCAACQGNQMGYRNGTMYSSYTAASFPRAIELAEKHGVNLEGALTWAFTFADQPPFAGFRQLASAGLDLPVLNVFRMFSKMSGQKISVTSSAGLNADIIRKSNVRSAADVSAYASLDKNKVAMLVWHYHDDDLPGADAAVTLQLSGIPAHNGKAKLTHYRIDANHGNAYEAWKKLGSPVPVLAKDFSALEKAGQLAELAGEESVSIANGSAEIKFNLPRQGVSLLVITAP